MRMESIIHRRKKFEKHKSCGPSHGCDSKMIEVKAMSENLQFQKSHQQVTQRDGKHCYESELYEIDPKGDEKIDQKLRGGRKL